MDPGSISKAALQLRKVLTDSIDDFNSVQNDTSLITIGSPASNLKKLTDDVGTNQKSGLNIFFYHVAYDGYPADGTPDNPFYVRIYCLITAVGHSDTTSGGENELRLIGEVMRVFHQQPVISVGPGEGDTLEAEVARLQVIPHDVAPEVLNHIWSTQGTETPYRISVAYEMTLAPVPLSSPSQLSPLAGAPQVNVWGVMARKPEKWRDGLISLKPLVEYLEIDTSEDSWSAHLAIVDKGDDPDQTLHYVDVNNSFFSMAVDVLIAGREEGSVKLFWDVWRRKNDNSVIAWKEAIADAEHPDVTIINDASGDPFYPNRIDPKAIDQRRVFSLRLPNEVRLFDTKAWQATLYAERDWVRELPAGSGLIKTGKARSNLLLLHGGEVPEPAPMEIDVEAENWIPHIVFIENHGTPQAKFGYLFEISDIEAMNSVKVMMAGKEGTELNFFWSFWRIKEDDSEESWQEGVVPPSGTTKAVIENDISGNPFHPGRIDPDEVDERRVVTILLPEGLDKKDKMWQADLYVEREWTYEYPPESGVNKTKQIRSNYVRFYGKNE